MTTNGHKPEKVEVDLSGLTIEDLIFIEAMGAGTAKAADMVAWLDRVVVGGARHRPLTDLQQIVEAISDHTADMVAAKN